jgi:hypothetical protein
MDADILKPALGNDLQYVVFALCVAMVVQTVGPKLMEIFTRKKLNSSESEEVNTDPKIVTMEQQVDRLTNDMGDIKGCMVDLKAMQIELLAQFRQMRDDNKDALVRVHDRIDTHLDGHPPRSGK